MICEQGPSAPSSPTSPGGSRLRRPSPLTADAMQRISLLTAGFDFGKLSPISPSYPTSDLGSSPRSSISVTSNQLGPWTAYRDHHRSSFDLEDGASDIGNHNLLSPGVVFSPAPFSPFSDCCSGADSPYSSYARSPNLSPNPSTKSLNHFSFDQIRSSSSMSNRHAHLLVPGPSFDQETRERSRSDSDMAPKDEKMDISQHSTISVPATTSRSSGQYKKRLLQKYEEQERKRHRTTKRSTSSPPLSAADSDVDDADLRSVSRQHTLDDDTGHSPNTETSSATTILSFHRVDSEPSIPLVKSATSIPEAVQSMLQGQQQIEEWMQRQISALHAATIYNQVVNTIIKTQNQLPTPDAPKVIAQKAFETEDTIGPVRTGGLWKGSASRGVSPFAPVAAAAAPSKDTVPPSGTHPESVIAGPYVCTSCGQAFSLHDRLAKHIASRHRERSATEEGNKTHKCTVCNKSFGRSDMLTRHMRLHTGSKPYSCPTCGQVFSRSDHLSTHLRTHTGEKPYACSLCSYTASRRDMISRHMRTHVSGDGSAIGRLI
ncbi:hypothetical protein WR25_13669 isoform C [Diploscapter pachys]|uniref:C2H2-type domain-containing protein n=1 Tax=Diploscapter pachys TaxID=2018661 RepID=A0A2A2KRV8_9BILA|nr:hypothetical protein WR25_13669 isoform C [Diploscapter pachys]